MAAQEEQEVARSPENPVPETNDLPSTSVDCRLPQAVAPSEPSVSKSNVTSAADPLVSADNAHRVSASEVPETLPPEVAADNTRAPSEKDDVPAQEAPAVDRSTPSSPEPASTTAPPAAPAESTTPGPSEPETSEITAAAKEEPAVPVEPAVTAPAISAETTESIGLKEAPKVAAEAVLHAGQAYVEAGKEASGTIRKLLSLRDKEGPVVTMTVDEILTAAFLVLVLIQLLFMLLFRPSAFRLAYSLFCGLAFGLGLSYLFYRNRKRKAEVNELLSVSLGFKGVQLVAAGLPAAFNLSDKEKMEWLNRLVVEVWPFVDKAVCTMIKDITAQTMPGVLASLPAGLSGLVKSVGFKHLTFGSAPVRVESIWVNPDNSEFLELELSVKWCGDPNITLAIELLKGQKLCPRIMDITLVATVRLKLGPMRPKLPGFVAMMATMPSSPLINYRLDFGKAMGGSLVPLAVTPVINYFIHDLVDQMLVWPARVVAPIMVSNEADLAQVQRLMRRHQGMLRVQVVRGKDLEGLGPFDNSAAELTTDSEHYAKTDPKTPELPPISIESAKNLPTGPVDWNQTLHLLIQEPDSQMLRMEVFDLTAGRGGRTVSMGGRRLVGRSLVKLNKVCKKGKEGDLEPITTVTQLGKHNWGAPGGPGKGQGKVVLRLTYFPFELITQEQVLQAQKGIVTVRVLAVRGIPAAGTAMAVYASVNTTAEKAAGKDSYRVGRRTWSATAHTEKLKQRVKALEAARARDLQEGREEDAAKKAAQIQELNQEAAGTAPVKVNASYQLDSYAIRVFYDVTEKLESGEDNKVVVKVYRQGKGVKSNNELAGMVEVPVSEIKNSISYNMMTGRMEYGAWMRGKPEYLFTDPDGQFDDSDWGQPLEHGCGGRVLVFLRWVPCIEYKDEELVDDDDDGDAAAAAATADEVQRPSTTAGAASGAASANGTRAADAAAA